MNSLSLPYFFFYHIHLFNHPNHLLAQQETPSFQSGQLLLPVALHSKTNRRCRFTAPRARSQKLASKPTFHDHLIPSYAALVFQGPTEKEESEEWAAVLGRTGQAPQNLLHSEGAAATAICSPWPCARPKEQIQYKENCSGANPFCSLEHKLGPFLSYCTKPPQKP